MYFNNFTNKQIKQMDIAINVQTFKSYSDEIKDYVENLDCENQDNLQDMKDTYDKLMNLKNQVRAYGYIQALHTLRNIRFNSNYQENIKYNKGFIRLTLFNLIFHFPINVFSLTICSIYINSFNEYMWLPYFFLNNVILFISNLNYFYINYKIHTYAKNNGIPLGQNINRNEIPILQNSFYIKFKIFVYVIMVLAFCFGFYLIKESFSLEKCLNIQPTLCWTFKLNGLYFLSLYIIFFGTFLALGLQKLCKNSTEENNRFNDTENEIININLINLKNTEDNIKRTIKLLHNKMIGLYKLKMYKPKEDEDITCPICTETVSEIEDDFLIPVCENNHIFHIKCILSYKKSSSKNNCPICRSNMNI